MRILVADPVAQEGVDILKKVADVDVKTGQSADALLALIPNYDAIVVRSETKVTADIINAGKSLKAIGRAGVGVDNIDVEAATRRGIIVVNAPTGNTIAAAEHTIALLMAMARHIPQAHAALKEGKWQRSKYVGTEVRGKTLGVVGLGRVGTEVARRAAGMQMNILAYDPFVTAEYARHMGFEIADLSEVLKGADFLTIHTPLTSNTKSLVGKTELATMKPTSRIINCARGGIVDEQALFDAVESGTIAGAAVDVFTQEPTTDNVLFGSDKIIVTPHLGASTEEAQVQVAVDVAEQIVSILNGQSASYAVNLPMVPKETLAALTPYLPAAKALGTMAFQLSKGRISGVTASYLGEIAAFDTALLQASLIEGLLSSVSEEQVNMVNATHIAKQRNLKISENRNLDSENYSSLIRVEVQSEGGTNVVAGTVMRGEVHIVHVDGYWIDIVGGGNLIFCHNTDRPGVIGNVGTLLGKEGVNISFMQVGRDHPRGRALMVLGVDEAVSNEVVATVAALPDVDDARLVRL